MYSRVSFSKTQDHEDNDAAENDHGNDNDDEHGSDNGSNEQTIEMNSLDMSNLDTNINNNENHNEAEEEEAEEEEDPDADNNNNMHNHNGQVYYDNRDHNHNHNHQTAAAVAIVDIDADTDIATQRPRNTNTNTNTNTNISLKDSAIPIPNPDSIPDNKHQHHAPPKKKKKKAAPAAAAAAATTIVRLRNIHKTYLLGLEGVPALRGVSLTIREGEFVVILGKSGGGKTSMLNIMGTIDTPTKGDLYLCSSRICATTTDSEVANLRLTSIGFCFQTFNLISSMTALENVELPMILNGQLSSAQIRARALQLLTHVGLADRCKHLPSQLSGGEQQRVTISRAIANKPKLLLLDEPTGDLDTRNSNIIMDLLVRLNREQRMTCVFVTHDVSLKYFAHRVVHMLDGKIHKIEIIPAMYRRQIEHELTQQVMKDTQQRQERQRRQMENANAGILNHHEMGASASASAHGNGNGSGSAVATEYRTPAHFYPYLKFKRMFDLKMQANIQLKAKYDEDGNEVVFLDENHNDNDNDSGSDMKSDDYPHSHSHSHHDSSAASDHSSFRIKSAVGHRLKADVTDDYHNIHHDSHRSSHSHHNDPIAVNVNGVTNEKIKNVIPIQSSINLHQQRTGNHNDNDIDVDLQAS